MKGNVVNKWPVISTKWSAVFLDISYGALVKEINPDDNSGLIKWQAKISDQDNSRPILGFEQPYLVEVKKALGPIRTKGKPLFTSEVRSKIERINKKWGFK